jgi:hypothetical protein
VRTSMFICLAAPINSCSRNCCLCFTCAIAELNAGFIIR